MLKKGGINLIAQITFIISKLRSAIGYEGETKASKSLE